MSVHVLHVLRELPRLAYRRSPEQVLARIRGRPPVGGPPAVELIDAERARR